MNTINDLLSLYMGFAFLLTILYKKCKQQKTYKISVDFLSDALSEALICCRRSQNGEVSQRHCTNNSVGLRRKYYHVRG